MNQPYYIAGETVLPRACISEAEVLSWNISTSWWSDIKRSKAKITLIDTDVTYKGLPAFKVSVLLNSGAKERLYISPAWIKRLEQ